MYLVVSPERETIKEYETLQEVKEVLKELTQEWWDDPCYSGDPTWKELYARCLANFDFGDIAQVYKAERIM